MNFKFHISLIWSPCDASVTLTHPWSCSPSLKCYQRQYSRAIRQMRNTNKEEIYQMFTWPEAPEDKKRIHRSQYHLH